MQRVQSNYRHILFMNVVQIQTIALADECSQLQLCNLR